jgi:hypothetical protein
MRSALALLVVTASGCNWVFGLEKTSVYDGGVDAPDAPPSIRTKLVWGATKSNSTQLDYAGILPDSPVILVGEPLGGMPLQTVAYDADGSFAIPYTLREAPHRIVYTLPGETLVHEVQWSVSGATLVVPRTSRVGAPPVPANSGYDLTPVGATAAPTTPLLMTTGVFTYTRGGAGFTKAGANTKFNFTTAKPLVGPLGAPELGKGDKVILADWVARGGGVSSIGGYAIASVDLMTGGPSVPAMQPMWVTTATQHTPSSSSSTDPIPVVNGTALDTRLAQVSTGVGAQEMRYGVSPSLNFPGFVDGQPVMLSFMEATQLQASFIITDPTSELGYDRVFAVRATRTRTVGSATLTSSIETITNQLSGMLVVGAPLSLNIKLSATDVSMDATYPASSQATTLKWEAESGYSAHDYLVTLYEIPTSGALIPRRVYQVLSPTVTVDGSLLDAGHKYTFAITARNGFPNAKQGDYKTVSYPFSEATTFTGAITVQ